MLRSVQPILAEQMLSSWRQKARIQRTLNQRIYHHPFDNPLRLDPPKPLPLLSDGTSKQEIPDWIPARQPRDDLDVEAGERQHGEQALRQSQAADRAVGVALRRPLLRLLRSRLARSDRQAAAEVGEVREVH